MLQLVPGAEKEGKKGEGPGVRKEECSRVKVVHGQQSKTESVWRFLQNLKANRLYDPVGPLPGI